MAQREFAEAQAAVQDILRKIESLYQRMDEARDDITRAQAVGSYEKISEIREQEDFIISQRRKVEETRMEARSLMAIAEEKQEALIAAAQERKILVKLREKRFAEYCEKLKRLETKELDDMTSVRQARGKR